MTKPYAKMTVVKQVLKEGTKSAYQTVETEENVITEKEYCNIVEASPFFRRLGGSEHHTKCYNKLITNIGVTNMLKWLFAPPEKALKDECAQRAVNEMCISRKVQEYAAEEKKLLALHLNIIEDLAQALKSEVKRKEHKVFQCKDFMDRLVLTRDRDGKIVVLDYHEID